MAEDFTSLFVKMSFRQVQKKMVKMPPKLFCEYTCIVFTFYSYYLLFCFKFVFLIMFLANCTKPKVMQIAVVLIFSAEA